MVWFKLIFLDVLFVCAIQVVLAFWPPTAQINNSRIVGQTISISGIPVHQYRGIPFAEPPLKELRYQKPKPITSYPKVLEATKPGLACRQFSHSYFPWVVRNINDRSEDCLYLNIWAPVGANRWNKKAVLYWIHGGDHRTGAGYDNYGYEGSLLAALGNIIVVTVNYRLAFFGFFTSNTPDAPGNVGVWDILEGLRWVNKYISAFGGDVSRITIGGQGSGAVDVGLLSISPLSRGLYARQIMQSGSPAYRRADNNTQNIMYSQQLASDLSCSKGNVTIHNSPKEVVDCLQFRDSVGGSADGIEIRDPIFSGKTKSSYLLVPQFGDEILAENPRLSVINNNFRCTDLLIGTNMNEGAYSLTGSDYILDFGKADPHVNRSSGESIIRKTVDYFPDPDAIVKYYLPPTLQNDTDHRIRHQVFTAFGDTVIACPAVYYAEKCAEQKKSVYFYHFNHQSRLSRWATFQSAASWMNGTHYDEMDYVLGSPLDKLLDKPYLEEEKILSNQVIDIWSNFVKYGNPGIPWPSFSKETPAFKYIGPDYVTYANSQGPHAKNCEFLRPHFGF